MIAIPFMEPPSFCAGCGTMSVLVEWHEITGFERMCFLCGRNPDAKPPLPHVGNGALERAEAQRFP